MKITKKKSAKSQTGITLIALVITIIVLLILAGVAISMLAGDNGILRQAADAKQKTNQASIEEQIKLAAMSVMTNENHKIKTADDLKKEVAKQLGIDESEVVVTGDEKKGYTVTANGEIYVIKSNGTTREANELEKLQSSQTNMDDNKTLIDEKKDSIVIPKNFKISSESPTLVTEGMIIEDSIGNQYVWIPVFEKSTDREWGVDYTAVKTKTEDTAEYYTAIETALKTYTGTYKNSSYTDVWYGDASHGQYGYYDGIKFIYYKNGNMTEEEYNNLYHSMLKSVYKNKGFYIGRYEMGVGVANSTTEAQELTRTGLTEYTPSGDTNTSTTVKTNAEPSIEGMNTPVSKANAVPYNRITQSQAQMLAEKLGEGTDYSNVNTSIMFGVQWDAVCVFIEKYDKNNTAEAKSDWLKNDTYGKLWGNYKNATFNMDQGFYTTKYSSNPVTWNNKANKTSSGSWLCTTGASDQNSSLNIYDFGGNLAEWTLERCRSTSSPSIGRGYIFRDSHYASYRNTSSTQINYYTIDYSSRPSLYIK